MSGLLIFGDQSFVDEFYGDKLSYPVVGVAHDMVTATNMLKSYDDVDGVVIGFRNGTVFALEMAELYRANKFFLILNKEEITAETYRQALSKGVHIIERANAIESINAELGRGARNERQSVNPEVAKELEHDMLVKKSRTLKSHCISLTSPKGGVGKTVTAVSLASYVASWAKKENIDYKVCLVDADAEGARSAGIWLGIANAPQSISVWASLNREPSWMELEQLLVRHEETGMYILPGPQSFKDAFSTELSDVLAERVIQALRWHFDLIILDLGSFVKNPTAIRAMQISSKVFVVVEPTLTVLRLLEEMTKENTLGDLKVDLSRVKLVLNMEENSPFTKSDIERSFGIPVATSLPNDRTVKRIENSGKCIPPSLAVPNSPYARGIASLARSAVDNEMIPVAKKRPWDIFSNLKCNFSLKLKQKRA